VQRLALKNSFSRNSEEIKNLSIPFYILFCQKSEMRSFCRKLATFYPAHFFAARRRCFDQQSLFWTRQKCRFDCDKRWSK